MILCNPFNPLGRAFTAEELRAVVELAAAHHVRVISDEIHAPLVYSGAHVHGRLGDRRAEHRHRHRDLEGWNTAGLKCAQIITTNDEDARTIGELSNLLTGEPSPSVSGPPPPPTPTGRTGWSRRWTTSRRTGRT